MSFFPSHAEAFGDTNIMLDDLIPDDNVNIVNKEFRHLSNERCR